MRQVAGAIIGDRTDGQPSPVATSITPQQIHARIPRVEQTPAYLGNSCTAQG
jgi:hypothetical protein